MELLMQLKYSFNRGEKLSELLINFKEVCFLSVLVVHSYAPFYQSVFQVIVVAPPYSTGMSFTLLICNLAVVLLAIVPLWERCSVLRPIWGVFGLLLKLFPYLLAVSMLTYSLGSAIHNDLMGRTAAIINIFFVLGYLLLHQFLNESLKFKESDFCNRRLISFPDQVIFVLGMGMVVMLGAFYGCLAYLFRSVFELSRLYINFEYRLISRIQIFHSLWQGYVALVTLMGELNVIDPVALQPVTNSLFIFTAGAVVSWIFSGQLVVHIAQRLLGKTQWGGERGQSDISSDRDQNQLQHFENEIKSLVQVILEKWKFDEGLPNYYQHYWKVFNQRVFVHRLRCEEKRCPCKSKRMAAAQNDEEVYVQDLLKVVQSAGSVLGKEGRLKVININLLVEIAKKPLKGYYELISLKRERNKLSLRLEVEDLVVRARECFDQIYYKNKVQNQQLDLMKVVECEEVMNQLQEELRTALAHTASFLDMFTYNTVKMAQVQQESRRLFDLKRSIEKKLERLVWDMGDSGAVGLALFVFYRMLEVYRSRENEFKKLGGQQVLKKRLMQKAQGESLLQEQGIIYIDLVEERGRIKKITQPISEFFGYAKQDMVGFNINLFMPTLFGKYHAKFLSNFIDKGRIKLLKERTRVVFGRNKKKFIFPINIKLKTEHLQHDQFGASALITKIDTSSDFIIAGAQARVEELTEGIYRRVFGKTLRQEVGKVSKLCLYKLIPGLNQVVDNWEEKMASKIHEGLLIFADRQDYLFEKFRYNRESTYSSISNKTKTLNLSITSITSNSIPLDSKSERFQYFSQLFKGFLTDINPLRLRAFKISYKYSRIRTSEFQVEMVEILSARDQLQGKEFQRELLNELNNVAEIYQLMEEHSPLARHLAHLEEDAEAAPEHRGSKELQLSMSNNTHVLPSFSSKSHKEMTGDRISQDEFVDEMSEEKKLFNPQMSEQSSLAGNTQSESKKQLLINAFNSNESALPTIAVFFANLALFLLLALLLALALLAYSQATTQVKLWNDTSYVLDVRAILEFRLALIEVKSFSSVLNFSLPATLLARETQLNNELTSLVKTISERTISDQPGGPYSFPMTLWDPVRSITYSATLAQVLSQILWLFEESSSANIQMLRANYQTLHTSLQQFYSQRSSYLQSQERGTFDTIKLIFSFYESLLAVTALCSLPLYIYFKREELAVRSKLAFMSVKEVRKAIARLRLTYDFMRNSYRKGAVTRLQVELSDKRAEKDEEIVNANKFIKITSEAEQTKLFKNPVLYALLVAFVVFFSNLSISLFVLSSASNSAFSQIVSAYKLVNDLEIKTPLLLNTYLANLNNAIQNTSQTNFSTLIINQTETGYFQLISQLSLPFFGDSLPKAIQSEATSQICLEVNCTLSQNFSLSFIANSFRNRFNYWDPDNGLTPTLTTITTWATENSIPELIVQVEYVLVLSTVVRKKVQDQLGRVLSALQVVMVILMGVLIPFNFALMVLISRRFLNLLNGIIRSAEEVFMHFPVSVLIENTYLTSYFNSKAKHGK